MIELAPFEDLVPLEHGLSVVVTRRVDHEERLRQLLRAIFSAAGGEHDDWDDYDRTMVEERRTAVLVTPSRVYTNPQ